MSHDVRAAIVAALVLAGTVACASTSRDASDRANRALAWTPVTTTVPNAPATRGCGPADPDNLTRSLRPFTQMPSPGHMPPGSFLSALVTRGTLKAGVDENTIPLSVRDPRTGRFEGFEIDLLKEIADAIIGTANGRGASLRPIPVITKEKWSVVERGDVDLTASAVSITCDRWKHVLFTIPYYVASEKLMVRTDKHGGPVFADGTRVGATPDIQSLDRAFAKHRICATAGSTAEQAIHEKLPHAIGVSVATRTDCLVALQDESVDAILLHDTFLWGFQQQDRNTKILAPTLGTQPYGIAVQHGHADLVRFINGLLLRMRASGRLKALYERNFAGLGAPETMPDLRPLPWLD